MDKPTITINGKQISLPPVKARFWREIIHFDEVREEIETKDFVDEHARIIALAFGVTQDEVLDNLSVDDILPTYAKTLRYVISLLSAKINKDTPKKNIDTAEKSI